MNVFSYYITEILILTLYHFGSQDPKAGGIHRLWGLKLVSLRSLERKGNLGTPPTHQLTVGEYSQSIYI